MIFRNSQWLVDAGDNDGTSDEIRKLEDSIMILDDNFRIVCDTETCSYVTRGTKIYKNLTKVLMQQRVSVGNADVKQLGGKIRQVHQKAKNFCQVTE